MNKKYVPVKEGGKVTKVDESVIANEIGDPATSNKSKVNANMEGKVISSNKSKTSNGVDALSNVNNADIVQTSNTNSKGKSDNGKSKNKGGMGKMNGKESSSGGTSRKVLETQKISTKNRFDILGEDNGNMDTYEWKEVKSFVNTACAIGVEISEEVMKDWTDEMVAYYILKWKKRPVHKASPEQKLKSKMESITSRIVSLNRNIHNNAKRNAEMMVEKSIVTIGDKNDVSYDKFYSQCFKAELRKVEELQAERGKTEVELFLLSNKPFDDDLKDIWTDNMMDYYTMRSDEIKSDCLNGHFNDIDNSSCMEEVEEERSGSADFMTQNEVSNGIDISMAQMQGGLADHPSNFQ